jgi:CheY-like chemotaxis protein
MGRKKVIVVEDDPDDQELFTIFYGNRQDIRLLPAVSNGIELIDYLQRAISVHDLPDLIVLDQNMPLMNGKQTLEFLGTSERFSKIPTVIYSTYTDANLINECRRLGARMVVEKPIDHSGYQKMMDDFLKFCETP